jgi:response regulator RpfG family c-di-GMP phosphodiesterase
MAAVTPDINQARAMRVAVKRIEGFAKQFGEVHRNLARHAAFPFVLTPDLLYQIWANFVPEAPWTAVAHVLLSRLCRQVGYEMYEMDIADRNLLLRELKDQFGQERLDELGEFLLDYVAQQLTDDDPDTQDLREAQEWTALAYTKPDEAARELAEALSSRVKQEEMADVLRLASLVETFAEPLTEAGFEPLLIYSDDIASFVRGEMEGAKAQLSKFSEQIRKKKVTKNTSENLEKLKLMVVDDEPDNLEILYRTFQRDFQVFKAHSGHTALEILEQEGEMAVIISDQRMPLMNGTEFLSRTVDHFPDTMRILLTGYTDVEDLVDAINSGKVFKYITKPWNPENVKAVVLQAADTYRVLKRRINELRRLLVLNALISPGKISNSDIVETSSETSKRLKLMVVDDEPDNLDLLYRTFRREFRVFKADSARTALEILEQQGEMAVIISDQRIPEMKGTEFFRIAAERFPDTMRMLLTGYTDVEDLVDAVNSGHVFKYITKPWNPETINVIVQQAADTYRVLKRRINELHRQFLLNKNDPNFLSKIIALSTKNDRSNHP